MLEPLAALGSLSLSQPWLLLSRRQADTQESTTLGSKLPLAPGAWRRLPWPEAALLFGVSVGKLRERYLRFQHAASLHEVTVSFLDLQCHLLKPQPGESSCEIQRSWRVCWEALL